MFSPEQLNQVGTLLNEARSIILIFPKAASFDVQAAALGLASSIQTGENKDVSLVTPSLAAVDPSLQQTWEIKEELGNKTLQVSFPYSAEKVDKVSYNIDDENQRFYLSIQPQKGEKPLDYHQLEYAYVGSDADLIILVGVASYESLEQLYFGYEDMFRDTTVISLNNFETTVGLVKLNSSGMSSLSEAVTILTRSLGMAVPADAATHLLTGIELTTKNFSSYSATADTFESVGYLLRQGARRLKKSSQDSFAGVIKYKNTQTVTPQEEKELKKDGEQAAVAVKREADGMEKKLAADYTSGGQFSASGDDQKKKHKAKNGTSITLTKKSSSDTKSKSAGSLQYQPSESSMGARG